MSGEPEASVAAGGSEEPREFTIKAIVLGILLAVVFGVGNAYLGLKVGLTVSASIPAAVMSMSLLRLGFRNVTIQENNIVQSMASAGEAVAAGAILTIPALVIVGEPLDPWRISLVSLLGGLLGVLLMVPLRHLMIVEEAPVLPYPEGKACAEILKAGARGRAGAWPAFVGVGLGALHRLGTGLLHWWPETLRLPLLSPLRSELSVDATPALLGVGYILGPRSALTMWGGGLLTWLVILPLIHFFGVFEGVLAPGAIPLHEMNTIQLWGSYARYIGAGCVAVGGITALIRVVPLVTRTVRSAVQQFRSPHPAPLARREDRDLPLGIVAAGILAISFAIVLLPSVDLGVVSLILLLIAASLFVAVTCITTGIVGSSSNPVSSMTITSLLAICGIFLALGWTDRAYLVSALVLSAILSVSIAMAGDTAQDLKTGFLVGATPAKQQVALLIGALLPAAAMGSVMVLLHDTYGLGSAALPAPQATLMAMIAQGVLEQTLPLTLVSVGLALGVALVLLRVNVLAAALGIYLPIQLSTALMVGGLIRWLSGTADKAEDETGSLLASGLVAGDSLFGVGLAGLTAAGLASPEEGGNPWLALGVLLALTCIMVGLIRKASPKQPT